MSADWPEFRTRAPGKWVLAGEHAVLRGATAVALPHPECQLELAFTPGAQPLAILPEDAAPIVRELLLAVREQRESEGRSFPLPRGTLELRSGIPIGAGLGSSAALCVALARWLAEPLGLAPAELFSFATRLEHRFHGRSSGMDVAVILAGAPISFTTERGARELGIRRLPRFTLHDCGARARTSECVYRVESLRTEDPRRAMELDEGMARAARLAMEGLMLFDRGAHGEGEETLARSLREGQECFYGWGLVPGDARRLEQDLLARGALAAKLTGAGGGGMVAALWPEREAPPASS